MLGFQVSQNLSLRGLLQCDDLEVQVCMSRPRSLDNRRRGRDLRRRERRKGVRYHSLCGLRSSVDGDLSRHLVVLVNATECEKVFGKDLGRSICSSGNAHVRSHNNFLVQFLRALGQSSA